MISDAFKKLRFPGHLKLCSAPAATGTAAGPAREAPSAQRPTSASLGCVDENGERIHEIGNARHFFTRCRRLIDDYVISHTYVVQDSINNT